jgi:hypothetical protein
MADRSCSTVGCTAAPGGETPAADASDAAMRADFVRVSGDEIERMIALCEAPALLWWREPSAPRSPEPFGMIA